MTPPIQVSAGSTISFALTGVTNPSVSGSTGSFQALYTRNYYNATLDLTPTASLPSGQTITPGCFSGSTPTTTLSSYVAGASSVAVTLAFTTKNSLPTSGKIVLTLPTNFTISGEREQGVVYAW